MPAAHIGANGKGGQLFFHWRREGVKESILKFGRVGYLERRRGHPFWESPSMSKAVIPGSRPGEKTHLTQLRGKEKKKKKK